MKCYINVTTTCYFSVLLFYLKCKQTYFRIRAIVSFLSFPWKGSEPVSISYWKTEDYYSFTVF